MNAAELDAAWSDLENRLIPDTARLQRRIFPHAVVRILIWTANPGATRSFVVEAPAEALAQIETMPEARGLRGILHPGGEAAVGAVELQLTDRNASDVFCSLAADVAEHVARVASAEEAVQTWLARLSRWQKLLARGPLGLSAERQRGLFAELWFLHAKLSEAVGLENAVSAWQAMPNRSHDFQLPGGSVEVKSTSAGQPQEVVINGERQLDETGTPSLHLLHVSLDVHRDAGTTLPQMVADVRGAAVDSPRESLLEDRLLEYGYADVHEPKYAHTGYTLREHGYFRVRSGFPRLVESDLPGGVGGVRYVLTIAACADFEVTEAEVLNLMRDATQS